MIILAVFGIPFVLIIILGLLFGGSDEPVKREYKGAYTVSPGPKNNKVLEPTVKRVAKPMAEVSIPAEKKATEPVSVKPMVQEQDDDTNEWMNKISELYTREASMKAIGYWFERDEIIYADTSDNPQYGTVLCFTNQDDAFTFADLMFSDNSDNKEYAGTFAMLVALEGRGAMISGNDRLKVIFTSPRGVVNVINLETYESCYLPVWVVKK